MGDSPRAADAAGAVRLAPGGLDEISHETIETSGVVVRARDETLLLVEEGRKLLVILACRCDAVGRLVFMKECASLGCSSAAGGLYAY